MSARAHPFPGEGATQTDRPLPEDDERIATGDLHLLETVPGGPGPACDRGPLLEGKRVVSSGTSVREGTSM